MRLEGFIWDSNSTKNITLDDYLHGNVIATDQLLLDYADILVNNTNFRFNMKERRNLARSLVTDCAQLLANQAINIAQTQGIRAIGVSGGVAYNEIIMQVFQNAIKQTKLEFIQHKTIPCGDAGISTGQIAATLAKNR